MIRLNIYDKLKKIFNHQLVKRYLNNSLWMLLARAGWIITALTVGVMVARKLGPENYGIVNYVVAYVVMFSVIVNLGVGNLITRNLILAPERTPRIMGNYLVFKIITTILMYVCFYFSIQYIDDREIRKYCIIMSLGYIIFPLTSVNEYFRAFVKNQYIAFSELLTCICYNTIRLVAVLCSASLIYFIYAESIQLLLVSIFFILFFILKCDNPLKWNFSLHEVFSLFKPALPLSIVVILGILYTRIDTLMLKYYQNYEEISYYSIATRFTENLNLIITSACAYVFASAIISGFKLGHTEYKKQLHRYYFLLISVAIILIIPSLLFGHSVIKFLYDKPFLPSVNVFYICVFTLIFSAVNTAFTCHAINENRLKTIFFISFFGILINIFINLYTIPRYAAIGAAISSVFAMPLSFLLVLSQTKKGRSDLLFILYCFSHLPSFKFNEEIE